MNLRTFSISAAILSCFAFSACNRPATTGYGGPPYGVNDPYGTGPVYGNTAPDYTVANAETVTTIDADISRLKQEKKQIRENRKADRISNKEARALRKANRAELRKARRHKSTLKSARANKRQMDRAQRKELRKRNQLERAQRKADRKAIKLRQSNEQLNNHRINRDKAGY